MSKFFRISESPFIRNIDSEYLLENFLIAAVVSVLAIRFYLKIMHYPKIGHGNFHIAHMLFGGFLMMMALVILIAFLNRTSTHLASIIGGIGFGTFIDELGKFITSDNNYFYQPTVALLYIIFILLYLSFRFIDKHSTYSEKEYLVNGLEMFKEAVINDMDKEEKNRTILYLKKSGKKDPLARALLQLVRDVAATPPSSQPLLRLRVYIREIYRKLVQLPGFANTVLVFFILQSIVAFLVNIFNFPGISELSILLLLSAVLLFIAIGYGSFQLSIKRILLYVFMVISIFAFCWEIFFNADLPDLTIIEWGRLTSSILSTVFVLTGVFYYTQSRLKSFRYFKRSVLVSIFLTQFFLFYINQFQALIGLAFNIVILLTLDYFITQEKTKALEESDYDEES